MEDDELGSSPPRTPPPRSPSIPQTPSSASPVNRTPSRINIPTSSPSTRKRRKSAVQHETIRTITQEFRTPSSSTPMKSARRRTIALNPSELVRVLSDSGRSSEAFDRRRTSFLRTPSKGKAVASQHTQESPSELLQTLAKMIAPGATPKQSPRQSPRQSLSRQDILPSHIRAPRTPRQSLTNRKLSGFLPGTPRRSSFRNTAFAGQSSRARGVRGDADTTPARVNKLAEIHTPSDILRLLTRMPDFQGQSSIPRDVQHDLGFEDIPGESLANIPSSPHGRESILPDMSLDEIYEQFQLLDEDDQAFIRDSLEFGFRHNRSRRGVLSSDDPEQQRRMTYNSDTTFGTSMWEDEDDDMGEPQIPAQSDVLSSSKRQSGLREEHVYEEDEIDLTVKQTQTQKTSVMNQDHDTNFAAETQSPELSMEREDIELEESPAPELEPGDEEDQHIEKQENQDMTDHGPTEQKQTRLSQMGFTPMEALQNRLSDAQISQSSRRRLEPQSPIQPPARPPVQVTLAQLAARNNAFESDVLRREIKAPAQKISEAGVVIPSLPKVLIRDLFQSFSKSKVSREALDSVIEASHQFFAQATEDLSVYANHAGRTMIQENDVQCLMRRQRILSEKVTLEALAHKLLPRELWDEICVSALANNELHPGRPPAL
ncbi:hypothetical protein INT43_008849 [Umbelopsis isabellina]|uniref:CENP-T/Histone H4 histone fold domain-containing protein n=1 Tax=Mortierella isabellina TaxID=91625 RepID=A0A8H7UD62_MORIS|nr:hypothetical protein INT43_008849 [Umbelopsis isabellina]